MVVITLSRRPLGAGSVAANVLQYGTGALNIDACRIRTDDSLNGGAYAEDATERHDGAENWRFKRGDIGGLEGKSFVQPTGRWPANLVLQHLAGCASLGVQRVTSNGRVRHKKSPDGLFVGGQPGVDGHADADGLETISAWSCVDGCPCLDLDRQSGSTQSPKTYVRSADGHNDAIYAQGIGEPAGATSLNYGDEGGASRYFKQVSGGCVSTDDILDIVSEASADPSGPPKDLLDYLYTMITPTHVGGESLVALDLNAVDWAAIPDGKYHGVIARGEPTQEQVEHLWRVVKPGAHVMLIAPDSCPTGHRGACTLEDKGFEIRDAILWVREAGRLHYVPKANTKERNAGTVPLAVKRKGVPIFVLTAKAAADEEVMEEVCSALTEAGVAEEVIDSITDNGILKNKIPDSILKHFKMQEGSGKYGNVHPTVKPKDVMKRLLSDVPKGVTVLDPFMGSGSMGIACLETGHGYIGIEKERDYAEIAVARLNHWNAASEGWNQVPIESEVPEFKGLAAEKGDGDALDLFGD